MSGSSVNGTPGQRPLIETMKRLLTVIAVIVICVGAAWFARHRRSVPSPTPSVPASPAEAARTDLTSTADPAATSSTASAVISTPFTQQRQQRDERLLSPEHDGWPTEAFAEAALTQLKALGSEFGTETPSRSDRLGALIAEPFRCPKLRPDSLSELFRDGITVVRERHDAFEPATLEGASGLSRSIDSLVGALGSRKEIETHFKIVSVRPGELWKTTVLVQLSAGGPDERRQVNATWICHWTSARSSQTQSDEPGSSASSLGTPKLTSIQITDYQESEIHIAQGHWFSDCTLAVLGDNPAIADQFAFGHHYWLQRIERVQRFDTSVRNGLAIGDVNGDGLDDLYVCQPPGLPNRLFVQNPNGTATDRSSQARVDYLDQTSAAVLCDLDNDGDQDLVLGTPAGILLLQNDSHGNFDLKTTLPADYDVQSLSAVDYDNDGRLDLFACVYRTALPKANRFFLYRDAVGGGMNRLFRSEIEANEWKFSEVTQVSQLADGADRYSLAASWEDYDNDGDQDLYVANDFGPNYLYENRDGLFVNVAPQAGVVDIGSGMSVSWGDFNRDGLMDLYVGNMFSSAGQRVTFQPKFRLGEDEQVREIYQRLAKGNSLFENQGDGTFREVGAEAGVERGRWAWSSLFVDLNNDGWEDLLVANGYMTTEATGDL